MPLTSQDIARQDQDMAGLDTQLDALLARIREDIAESGEPQATANTAMMLTQYATPDQNADLLLAALRRLARQPGTSDQSEQQS